MFVTQLHFNNNEKSFSWQNLHENIYQACNKVKDAVTHIKIYKKVSFSRDDFKLP